MGLNESRRLHCKEFTITEFRTEPDGNGQQADGGLLGDNNMRLSLAVRDIPINQSNSTSFSISHNSMFS